MSLTRSIALCAALVLLGMGSAMAQIQWPAPTPETALAQAEETVQVAARGNAQLRNDEKVLCHTAECHRDFDLAIIASLNGMRASVEYRLAAQKTDRATMDRLWKKMSEADAVWLSRRNTLNVKWYAKAKATP